MTATFIAYFGFAAAMGVLSNFQKPIGMLIASAAVVMTSFLLDLFAGPLMTFALFYAVPYSATRFSYQFTSHILSTISQMRSALPASK